MMKRGTSLVVTLALVAGVATAAFAQARPATPGAGTGPSTPYGVSPSAAPRTTAAPAPGSAPSAGATAGGGSAVGAEYTLGPGDVIVVSVWKNDALSRVVPIRPDGKISLPLLHDIVAAGLTSMQLRDKIATSLGEFLPNPEVSVTVAEVHSFRISVLGEVLKPGVYELRSAATVLEAIAMAGGLGPFASASKISVIRKESNGQTKKVRFNYHRAVTANVDEDNLVLQPGDVVVVP